MSTSSPYRLTPPRPKSQGKHLLTVWGTILGFGLAALIATYMLFVEAPPPRNIVIATGVTSGAQKLAGGLTGPQLEEELARLRDISLQVAFVEVPLSYMEEFYHLRLHLAMLQQHLIEVRARTDH